jgi:hypothetical protein
LALWNHHRAGKSSVPAARLHSRELPGDTVFEEVRRDHLRCRRRIRKTVMGRLIGPRWGGLWPPDGAAYGRPRLMRGAEDREVARWR